MSLYESGAWSAPGRSYWEQPPTPSRSGASSTVNREDASAFSFQFEEIDRAADNLFKTGKMFSVLGTPALPGRRDSMPVMGGRHYPDFDPRAAGSQRHHSVSEHESARSHSAANLQNFYANQRYNTQNRPTELEQMAQVKRRMAAQRERELRNYHQEQQYNRNMPGAKSDRSVSPTAMPEDERRDLIARQHRALYGNDSSLYSDVANNKQSSQDARIATTIGGSSNQSPLAFDPFGMQRRMTENAPQASQREQGKDMNIGAAQQQQQNQQQQQSQHSQVQQPPQQQQRRSRANSTSSPSSNPTTSFSLFDSAAQQSSRTSNSSPGGSPPRQGANAATAGNVAPIGTRPYQGQGQAPNFSISSNFNKRTTTPLPSPLSYGFTSGEQAGEGNTGNRNNNGNGNVANPNERSTSAASNPSSATTDKGVSLGWGTSSGVWGSSKGSLGVQASVWG